MHTLNLYNIICRLYLRKSGGQKNVLGVQVLEAGIKKLDGDVPQPTFSFIYQFYAVSIPVTCLLVNLTYFLVKFPLTIPGYLR